MVTNREKSSMPSLWISCFYRKARHNGNGDEFRCSTPGYNAAIWLKLDSVNFAESNLLKTRFQRKNSL